MSDILENFKKYLVKRGYSDITPSGLPSTTTDYSKRRIPKICERENITLNELSKNINHYIDKYDKFGSEFEFGKKSNNAYINALKRFQEFLNN
ncbi:hypothetical protein [Winogradskyella sp.]|uniref:hypothetical protein n=1 Tax=Winogradskyella sp. TaxID=1883156 RepID=UPI001B29CD05|nr:hypothetical protein [Winogradskyella sp.]MBO6880559.1 hypothetical protein [Winogradskyella sp.]